MATRSCANCEAELQVSARFCHNCGLPVNSNSQSTELPGSASLGSGNFHRLGPRQYLDQVAEHGERLTSERRFVTTLFCDVVGSTSIAEKLDPEEVTTLMNDAFREMMGPVHRYEGTLARLMGDGVLCLFGAPISHEDDALRACKAAAEIMLGVESLSEKICPQYDLPTFEVRIGISTGLAVVGEVGTTVRSEYTAMGDAVNLAARLQHAAAPGEILVCGETWQLVNRHFSCRDSNTLRVRGRSQRVSVYSLDFGGSADEGQLITERNPRMVGRHTELAALKEAFARLDSGRGGIVSIHGRAGIGKSRLLREALRLVPSQFGWIEATCMAYMQTVSYWVIREFVSQLINLGSDGDNHDLMSRLRRLSREAASRRAASDSEFAELAFQHAALSMCAVVGQLLQEELNESESTFVKNLSAESLNQKILSEVVELVRLRATSRRLVLVFEDIHWIDPESLLMLKTLTRKILAGNVLLLLVSRSEQRTACDEIISAATENSTAVTELQLGRLSPAECRELTDAFFENTKLPEEIVERIIEITEGNAFFLQEMLRAVPDSASPDRMNKAIAQGEATSSFSIPQTVQAAILSRVDQLSARTRSVLQTAAVLGRTFSLNLLARMLKPSLSARQISEALLNLLQRSFLSVEDCPKARGQSPIDCAQVESSTALHELEKCCEQPAECGFYFNHALLQEVVYGTLLYSKRRELHASAGEALEAIQSAGGQRHLALLAFHFDRGAKPERAIRYYALAARQAADIYSLDSSFAAYSRALELLPEGAANGDDELLAQLYEGIGDVHFLRSDYQEALDYFDKALAIQTSKPRLAELQFKKGKLLQKWGRHTGARQAFETALDSLKEDFDEQLAGKVYAELSLAYYHLNDLEVAEELGTLALILEQKTEDQTGIAQASNNLGVVLTRKGDWEKANGCFAECMRVGVERGDSYGLAACYNNWGLLAVEQQDWSAARERFEKSRELFQMFDNLHGLARVYDNLSQVFYCQGDEARAEEYLNRAVSILAEIGMVGKDPQPEMWQSGAW